VRRAEPISRQHSFNLRQHRCTHKWSSPGQDTNASPYIRAQSSIHIAISTVPNSDPPLAAYFRVCVSRHTADRYINTFVFTGRDGLIPRHAISDPFAGRGPSHSSPSIRRRSAERRAWGFHPLEHQGVTMHSELSRCCSESGRKPS
jgi:hypothetical protein